MKSARIKRNPNAVALVDLGSLVGRSVQMDDTIRRSLSDARRRTEVLRKHLDKFSERLEDLESQDKLGNFEIQDLMSQFNQTETLASSIMKKRDDTGNAIIGKI